jgi:hypothetical protein
MAYQRPRNIPLARHLDLHPFLENLVAEKRDEFLVATKRILRDRVGGNCSRPECGRTTVAPGQAGPAFADVTGRAAHITGARKGGPRYDPALTPEQRRSAENGIWLCADDADLVDKNEGQGFSVEQLRSWKRGAEEKQVSRARLRAQPHRPAWLDQLKSPDYVNVPRLVSISEERAISRSTLDSLAEGFPRDRYILNELLEVVLALRRATIEAVDVDEIKSPAGQLREGLTISFYGHARAKNAHQVNRDHIQRYSFEKSPQIYVDRNRYRYVFPFDPAWLTTDTALNIGGSCTLAGVGIIKSIDHSARAVIATPLAFGIPSFFDM